MQYAPVQVADLKETKPTALQDIILRAGYRALLVMLLIEGVNPPGTLLNGGTKLRGPP